MTLFKKYLRGIHHLVIQEKLAWAPSTHCFLWLFLSFVKPWDHPWETPQWLWAKSPGERMLPDVRKMPLYWCGAIPAIQEVKHNCPIINFNIGMCTCVQVQLVTYDAKKAIRPKTFQTANQTKEDIVDWLAACLQFFTHYFIFTILMTSYAPGTFSFYLFHVCEKG